MAKQPTSRTRGHVPRRWLWLAGGVVVCAAGFGIAQIPIHATPQNSEPIHHDAVQPPSAAKKVWVSSLSGHVKAPDFTLTDQHGKTISLKQLRGKAVVLEFMDPKCTDICPIASHEIAHASRRLGRVDKDTVFLTVNVNEYHNKIADVRAFSKAEGLDNLTNWHFVTGSPSKLKAIWKAYGVAVTPSKTGDVQHSSVMYFISPKGIEKYLGHPTSKKSSIDDWANAIAWYVQQSW